MPALPSGAPSSAPVAIVRCNISTARSVEKQKLLASDGGSSDVFGHAVAADGINLVVGAYGHDSLRGNLV